MQITRRSLRYEKRFAVFIHFEVYPGFFLNATKEKCVPRHKNNANFLRISFVIVYHSSDDSKNVQKKECVTFKALTH